MSNQQTHEYARETQNEKKIAVIWLRRRNRGKSTLKQLFLSLVYLPCFSFSVWFSINPHECRTLTIIIVANKMVAIRLKKCARLRKAMVAFPPPSPPPPPRPSRWCALLSFVIVALSRWLLPALPAHFLPCCDFIFSSKIGEYVVITCFCFVFIFCSPLNCGLFFCCRAVVVCLRCVFRFAMCD